MTDTLWPGDALKQLSDMATNAHTDIQRDFPTINPVVGLRRGMRDIDIPADALTIDCLSSQRRIVLVLHDAHPDTLIYQFTRIDDDADAPYQQTRFGELSSGTLYGWIKDYFSSTD